MEVVVMASFDIACDCRFSILPSNVSGTRTDVSNPVNEDDVLTFIRAHVRSVYTLEVLLLINRDRDRRWHLGELVHELRSSSTAVSDALNRLSKTGFVSENPAGIFSFAPKSPEHERMAAEIVNAYTNKPMTVVKAIMAQPDEKLRAFSDAFKLKE
jgi:hypothetical protein